KEEPPQDSDIRQLIREECCVEASEEQKQKDESKCDVPICANSPIYDNYSEIFSDSKIDDDISVYDEDFENIKYVEASLSDLEIVSVEEENVVHQAENDVYQEEEVDLEDISQIQDVVLREKLLSITRLISNIESLNDNPIPDHVLNSFESANSLLDNFSPEFKTFCDHTKETRSGNTTHADNSLSEYDLFFFEIKPGQERLIYLVKNNISDNLSNDTLLEEADLFLASDNSIPPGIENFADDPEGDIRFIEELLINDYILSHESSDSNFEDNPSIPRPPPESPDAETDAGEEILVMMNDKDEMLITLLSYLSLLRCFLFSSQRVRILSLILGWSGAHDSVIKNKQMLLRITSPEVRRTYLGSSEFLPRKTNVETQLNSPLQEIIILDTDDQPMWESANTISPNLGHTIVQPDVDDNFIINSTHLKMIWKNKFNGYLWPDPHDHLREFIAIYDIFKYGETQSEAVKLLMFPLSLCDDAKTWFNELNEESITSWDQMKKYFIIRFFPPSIFYRLLLKIRCFTQLVCENLIEAWLRLKNMPRKCHGPGLTKGAILHIFYHGLDEPTQAILDGTTGGIYLYKVQIRLSNFLIT
nr:reverse transcriptase domain-containing protein [Tanacetum cinerariifolium]